MAGPMGLADLPGFMRRENGHPRRLIIEISIVMTIGFAICVKRQCAKSGKSCIRPNNMCGLKGVSRNKQKWRARIKVAGECIDLGQVSCPAAAHFAYVVAADKFFGEYARNG